MNAYLRSTFINIVKTSIDRHLIAAKNRIFRRFRRDCHTIASNLVCKFFSTAGCWSFSSTIICLRPKNYGEIRSYKITEDNFFSPKKIYSRDVYDQGDTSIFFFAIEESFSEYGITSITNLKLCVIILTMLLNVFLFIFFLIIWPGYSHILRAIDQQDRKCW